MHILPKTKAPDVDSRRHPLRHYLIKYYTQRWSTKLGILNPLQLITLRLLKKEIKKMRSSITLIEEIKKEVVLFKIEPQGPYNRPELEIYQRLEKI